MVQKSHSSKGAISIFAILGIVFLGGLVMIGGVFPSKKKPISVIPAGEQTSPLAYTCCDSGDGDACKASDTDKFTWKGKEYGLIKSGVAMQKGKPVHLIPLKDKDPNGNIIFVNETQGSSKYAPTPGCEKGKDIVGEGSGKCVGIPNDQVIYVCTDNCSIYSPGFGSFNAYFRISDGAIPDVIKNCTKPTTKKAQVGGQKIIVPTGDSKQSLQLKTIKIVQNSTQASWLAPYCKPAIYLYPEKTSEISVKINPIGPITYTDPEYKNGWKVIAEPNGNISYASKIYDYLYYEAQIPDDKLEKPKEGYVVSKAGLSPFFERILPKLGLEGKEKSQFSEYWLKVLPDSPFYFIGIMPKSYLDKISPLTISPTPKNVIRVTLYFEPLTKDLVVSPPNISDISRDGFTVVEWGGIFKSDKNHNFSCFQ